MFVFIKFERTLIK